MKNKPSKAVLDWMNRADSDLSFAKKAFAEFDEFYSHMCVLSHDAAEKYLKAFIISRKKKYKRIHDLLTLLNDCSAIAGQNKNFMDLEEECRVLNNYYIPLKYPSHYPLAVKNQAKQAIAAAETIRDFVKSFIHL